MVRRSALVLLVVSAAAGALGPAFAGNAQPTVIVPEAGSADSAGMYITVGMGPEPSGTDQLEGYLPTLVLTGGASFPIQGKAYVDVGLYLSAASYTGLPSSNAWWSDATVGTAALTVSGRMGHTGRSVAVFGSAGIGLAHVSLDAPTWLGFIYTEVDSVWTPVLTVAGSLETPARKHNRFLAELRYSWINADFGIDVGGSLNAGGAALLLGWRHVF